MASLDDNSMTCHNLYELWDTLITVARSMSHLLSNRSTNEPYHPTWHPSSLLLETFRHLFLNTFSIPSLSLNLQRLEPDDSDYVEDSKDSKD
jgi:hypothetical protein